MKTAKLEEKLYTIKKALRELDIDLKYFFYHDKEVYSFTIISNNTATIDNIETALVILNYSEIHWLTTDINNTLDDRKYDLKEIGYTADDLKIKGNNG